MARDGDNYRLTVLGLAAAGDADMRRAIEIGDELYARLLEVFRNPETRRKAISLTDVTEPLSVKGNLRTVHFRQLSEAFMLWCEQYTTDFDDPNAIIRVGEGVHRYKGITSVLTEMERWHQSARATKYLSGKDSFGPR
jgi:hypothetical protein